MYNLLLGKKNKRKQQQQNGSQVFKFIFFLSFHHLRGIVLSLWVTNISFGLDSEIVRRSLRHPTDSESSESDHMSPLSQSDLRSEIVPGRTPRQP